MLKYAAATLKLFVTVCDFILCHANLLTLSLLLSPLETPVINRSVAWTDELVTIPVLDSWTCLLCCGGVCAVPRSVFVISACTFAYLCFLIP